jgi:hypothetical protein
MKIDFHTHTFPYAHEGRDVLFIKILILHLLLG